MFPHSDPVIPMFDHAERYGLRHASQVISLLPSVDDYMSMRGVSPSKLHIIPNGISPEEWKGECQPITGKLSEYVKTAQGQGKMIVGYAGAHGLPNALDTLLDAARLLKNQPICFVLVGNGHEKAVEKAGSRRGAG